MCVINGGLVLTEASGGTEGEILANGYPKTMENNIWGTAFEGISGKSYRICIANDGLKFYWTSVPAGNYTVVLAYPIA